MCAHECAQRDIQYNCSVQHSEVSAKHARLATQCNFIVYDTNDGALPSKEPHSNTGCNLYARLLKKYTLFL